MATNLSPLGKSLRTSSGLCESSRSSEMGEKGNGSQGSEKAYPYR